MRLSPYFRALAREKRICPECLRRYLEVRPAGESPNVAVDWCECGYRQVVAAPRSMRVGRSSAASPGGARPAAGGARVAGREGNIIRVDFKSRRAGE